MTSSKRSRKRLRAGDVLELCSSHGFAYVLYLGRHPENAHAIYVYPAWHKSRLESFEVLERLNGYMTFYPAQAALSQGLVEVVASLPLPIAPEAISTYRRAGACNREGDILTWIVERDGKEILKRKLTAADRKLPIAAIWNHEYLIDRITENWRPEQEG